MTQILRLHAHKQVMYRSPYRAKRDDFYLHLAANLLNTSAVGCNKRRKETIVPWVRLVCFILLTQHKHKWAFVFYNSTRLFILSPSSDTVSCTPVIHSLTLPHWPVYKKQLNRQTDDPLCKPNSLFINPFAICFDPAVNLWMLNLFFTEMSQLWGLVEACCETTPTRTRWVESDPLIATVTKHKLENGRFLCIQRDGGWHFLEKEELLCGLVCDSGL